jgi:threonine 3-dehydrogenase
MTKKMQAVMKNERAPGLEMVEKDVPTVGRGQVLVHVLATSICGTDLHIYRWDKWSQGRVNPPIVAGHEITGEIAELGEGVTRVKIGEKVSLESHEVCGTCRFCRAGRGDICENTAIIGVDRDGGFADYIAINEENARVLPPGVPLNVACLMENFGNSVHTVSRVSVEDKHVLVTGCGPAGVMAIAVAKAEGAAHIYATDISDYRLNMARRMGANTTINAANEDVVGIVMDGTNGEGAAVLIEMSGAPSAINEGFAALSTGGVASLLGLTPGPFEFDLNNGVVFKSATVYGVVGRRLWDTWDLAYHYVQTGKVDLNPMVTHRFKLSEFDKAFETFGSGQSGKVMMTP